MNYYTLSEWLNLAFRWTHVFSGILWIGATWYFTWLDRRFHTTDPEEVWMVHSGGFYVVRKQSSPSPKYNLHWFKWEAAITWLSGMSLLVLVYYMGGLMGDGSDGTLTGLQATGVGIGVLVGSWFIYDLLLARNAKIAMILGYILIVALTWGLTQVMPSRAAFMHIGAMLGTLMAANVWVRIIPGQAKMVAAAREGLPPDQTLADSAKMRSTHNTYMVMPVIFVMISSHFPTATYGNQYNWIVMAVLILVGWGAAHIVRSR